MQQNYALVAGNTVFQHSQVPPCYTNFSNDLIHGALSTIIINLSYLLVIQEVLRLSSEFEKFELSDFLCKWGKQNEEIW